MTPQAFIFIGRSGCGKGTQADLLIQALKRKDPKTETLRIETGEYFREFIQGPSETERRSKVIYDAGGLQPEFLSIHMWSLSLVDHYKGGEHLIFDGTPRRFHEAGALHSIFEFYGFPKPWVINIDISAEEALKRLTARKRLDDNEDDIKVRLSWYETEVAPTIDFYRRNGSYNFLRINGERPIEEVREDIARKVGLL